MNEQDLFLQVLKQPDAAGRQQLLDQACNGQSPLRHRVEVLLRAHEGAGAFLESPAAGSVATLEHPQFGETPGAIIGPYKLLQQIGEGGMGVVYMAEQQEPVRRRVALKIIKPGMDTKQVIARFEAERQALAMMDHQNIAKVHDAGTTGEKDEGGRMKDENQVIKSSGSSVIPHPSSFSAAGRPYFVMELVHGIPITDFCNDNRLTPRQRLELFIPVCHAIQHAHQKGIIHRDIKPSNILVTMYDDKPVPKVIDFGVAKAVEQRLTEKTLFTQYGTLVGTFEYMSPEQAQMNAFGVDTRSDIYSLGVLLYELLTGTTPFDKQRLKSSSFDEIRRIIREEEPETVSLRLARTKSSHHAPRDVPKGLLSRSERATATELDWIVAKSLEKDRSRRYESASALAADIQRYLSDEPVLACPPTTMYRVQKFARKNKPALFTAASLALCLLLGTTVSAWQAVRATTAEAKANANEQKANANANAAQEKEQEAIKQRDEVKALADKLVAKDLQLRRTLYDAHMNLAQRAWNSQNVPRVNELLDQYRPKPGETDLRGFEWHYLNKLCHPELFAFPRYYIVAYSPDGKRMAMSADDHVKVLDAQTNRELLLIKAKDARLAFSSDSKRLAAAVPGEYAVKVWDAQTGAELHTFKSDDKGFISRVAFSPDGTRLANNGHGKKAVTVRDSESGREIFSIPGEGSSPPGRYVGFMAFSPDGKRLATSGNGQVIVWDAQTGQEILALKGRMVNNVVYSPDGTRLASGSQDESLLDRSTRNYRLRLWNAQSGEVLLTFKGDPVFAIELAFSPDGKRLAAALNDRTVKVWDTQTGDELVSFIGHNNNVLSLEFDPAGRKLALAGGGGGVKIFDVASMLQASTFDTAGDYVRKVDLSPDGKRLAGITSDQKTGDFAIKLWDAQTGQEIRSFKEPPTNQPFVVTISPDSKLLAAGFGTNHEIKKRHYLAGEVKVWDIQTGREIVAYKGHTTSVVSLSFSPDSTRLASCGGLSSLPARLPDQGPGEVKVWDVATGQETLTLPATAKFVYSVAYSPDGKRLATLSLDKLNVWDAKSGRELLSLPAKSLTPGSVAFSPDGKRLASTNEFDRFRPGQVKLFDSETGKELLILKGHTGYVTRIAFSPDGKRLALGGARPELKLWDIETGEELLAFDDIGSGGVSFSLDGHRLVTTGAEGLKIFDATPLPQTP